MWKLILPLLLVALLPLRGQKETVLIILDDCQKWRKGLTSKNSEILYFSKNVSSEPRVSFIHGWLDPKDSLSKKPINHPVIKDAQIYYTSQLKEEDWYKLSMDSGPRIFILRPDDFCSKNRFVLDYKFIVYEVILNVSREE